MLTIKFGVVDIPYLDVVETKTEQKKRVKSGRKAPKPTGKDITTGDVAEILEAKYHVMEHFSELCRNDIMKSMETSLAGALEGILQGAPKDIPGFAGAESAIKARFDQFVTLKEMDALGYPGIPTQASLDGVSHRFKNPYKKRPPRPSFIDTGLYLQAAIIEIEEQ